MKIICQQKEFNTHLAIAGRAVPARPTHLILGSILLEADIDTNQVTLTGFDLNIGITTTFDAEVIGSGKVAIPAKLLTDIVSRLPEGELTLSWEPSLEENEDRLILINLTTASGKFQFSGSPAEEFPELPTTESVKILELPVSVLTDGMKALFAASNDETKQILLGVNIAWDNSIKFAATDGHRLSVVNTAKDDPELYEQLNKLELDSITIHRYALEQLKAILAINPDSGQDYLIELQIDKDQLIFHAGDQKLYCRRMEGKYPAYEQLIPQQFCREAVVNRKEMLSAVKLVSIISSDDYAKATFDEDLGITLVVNATDVGSGTQAISAEITGEPIEIGFNLKYLISAFCAIDSTEVKMQFNKANTPVIISPLGGLDMTVLIMPIQIKE